MRKRNQQWHPFETVLFSERPNGEVEIKIGVAVLKLLRFGKYVYYGYTDKHIFVSPEDFTGAKPMRITWEYGYISVPIRLRENMRYGDGEYYLCEDHGDIFIVKPENMEVVNA